MSINENLDTKIKKIWPKDVPLIDKIDKYIKKYSKEKTGKKPYTNINLVRN